MYALYLAIQIARRMVETLPLPLVHVRPNRVAIGAMKFGIDVDERLNVIISGGNVAQTARWMTRRTGIQNGWLACGQCIDVQSKKRRGVSPPACLQARLGEFLLRDEDENTAGDCAGMRGLRKRYFKSCVRGRNWGGRGVPAWKGPRMRRAKSTSCVRAVSQQKSLARNFMNRPPKNVCRFTRFR